MMPWTIILATSVAVIMGVGCWAWKTLPLRLDLKLGPGVRFSASVVVHPEPYVAPVSLPELPYINDDIKYLKIEDDLPGPESGSTAEEAGRRDRDDR
jgi:hypothetical protein